MTRGLREELDAANRTVALASAMGPAAAIEQRYVHKMTMLDFQHEETLKARVSEYDPISPHLLQCTFTDCDLNFCSKCGPLDGSAFPVGAAFVSQPL